MCECVCVCVHLLHLLLVERLMCSYESQSYVTSESSIPGRVILVNRSVVRFQTKHYPSRGWMEFRHA